MGKGGITKGCRGAVNMDAGAGASATAAQPYQRPASLVEDQRLFAGGQAQLSVYEADPASWNELADRLLALGGEQVILPPAGEGDLAQILAAGQAWKGNKARLVKGRPISCHENSARLYQRGKGLPVTGYALSEDGLWRQHSWVEAPNGSLIETTVARVGYYGIRLEGEDAEAFAYYNR